ncbi:MAG: hypothetical protein ABJE66_01330 [Deltaproteobacteria bacterium]
MADSQPLAVDRKGHCGSMTKSSCATGWPGGVAPSAVVPYA